MQYNSSNIIFTSHYSILYCCCYILLLLYEYSNVYSRLWDTFLVILLTQGIETMLISAFIMLLVYRLITKYVLQISDHTRRLDVSTTPQPIGLPENKKRLFGQNEIEDLIETINQMQRNITDAYGEIRLREAVLSQAQRIANTASWYKAIGEDQITCSNSLKEILGYTKIAQSSFDNLIKRVPVDDRECVIKSIELLHEKKLPFSIKHKILRDDGATITVENQAQIYYKGLPYWPASQM